MVRINPDFRKKIYQYGAFDLSTCYNCGNCTAVCSLSTAECSFPRELVRYSVIGAEDKIQSSLKPWQCYYCGECSDTCPQVTNPGELMMSLRRYLTVKYDWTGLSGLLYRSLPFSLLAFLLTALAVIGFAYTLGLGQASIMHYGHLFEMLAIVGVFVAILAPNVVRMWHFTIRKPGISRGIKTYITCLGDLFIHMFTQKRARDCEDNQMRWIEHLILVSGYLLLLFTTVVLDWFSTDSPAIIILGYAESGIVFILTFDFILSRIRKRKQISQHSRPSDWFFVIWLFLIGLSAFIVRLLIDTAFLETHFWVYLVHLIILVQWALIIVPFGKWTHFLYRSFALYFAKLAQAEK